MIALAPGPTVGLVGIASNPTPPTTIIIGVISYDKVPAQNYTAAPNGILPLPLGSQSCLNTSEWFQPEFPESQSAPVRASVPPGFESAVWIRLPLLELPPQRDECYFGLHGIRAVGWRYHLSAVRETLWNKRVPKPSSDKP